MEMKELLVGETWSLLQGVRFNKSSEDRLCSLDAASSIAMVAHHISATTGSLWVVGNGGSAASAMHICQDASRFGIKALTPLCPVALTAAINDIGGESVFESAISRMWREGDSLLVLSVSGSSPNLMKLFESRTIPKDAIFCVLGCHGSGSLTAKTRNWIAIESNDYVYVELVALALVMAALSSLGPT